LFKLTNQKNDRFEGGKTNYDNIRNNGNLPKNFRSSAEEKGFPGCHLLRRLNHLGKIARENDAAKETSDIVHYRTQIFFSE
jgi:hypothetical protein